MNAFTIPKQSAFTSKQALQQQTRSENGKKPEGFGINKRAALSLTAGRLSKGVREMSEIKDGGPAFPVTDMQLASPKDLKEMAAMARGMTLRDYFAAKALPAAYATAMEEAKEGSGLFQYDDWRVGLALDAYMMADAMLKAREQ